MCSQRQHLSLCVLLSVLILWLDLTSGMMNIQLIPQYPVIGGSVTLSVTGITGRIHTFIWYKGPYPDAKYQILTYIIGVSSPQINGPLYFSRARPLPPSSLLISDLHLTDSDNYTVKVQTDTSSVDASVTLTVYERVSKPKVTAPTFLPKENVSLTLTCDTSNAERILWSRGSVRLPSGHILSADNRTVTLHNVTRADSGDYRCEAENPISKSISDPYTVTVSYGPENVQITGQLRVSAGTVISLTCSAGSVPPPSYQWRLNDTDLNIKQNQLRINNASPENQGTYICVVNNTLRTATKSVFVYVNASTAGQPALPSADKTLIIGIVAAVLLLVILAAAIFYLFMVRKRRKKASDTNSLTKIPPRNGQASAPTMEQPELQYAAIDFNKNMPRKQQQEPELQYADVKIKRNMPRKPQEQPELQYAEIELNRNMPRRQQQPSELYENRRVQGPPPPENIIYSELR
ncbi:cell adhesion molecule CEACAM8-like isoform X1 [Mixophyes fleayi]|uniref:cell adhesion molecule CEACAM8-like isoform X1 n=1 Tax=Mixophyes fleayi TaxID=3061075 RepID=UPI003F4DD012